MKNMIKLPAILLGLLLLLTGITQKAMAQDDDISLETFYDELSPYGQWIQDPDYGYVWRPDVDRNDFRPYYTNGHWAMTEYGNTWISDYDWGWAPFHYGRWVLNSFNDWIWIPDTVWGPAWVTWRSGGGYYGWAPLRPGLGIDISIGSGGYDIPFSWWVFIPQRTIYSSYYPRYYGRNRNIYNRTTYINYTYRSDRHVYYTGPRANDIRRVTNRNVTVYNINRSTRPGRTNISNNNINIYSPRGGRSGVNTGRPSQPDRNNQGNAVRPGQPGRTNNRNNESGNPANNATRPGQPGRTNNRNNESGNPANNTTRPGQPGRNNNRNNESRNPATNPRTREGEPRQEQQQQQRENQQRQQREGQQRQEQQQQQQRENQQRQQREGQQRQEQQQQQQRENQQRQQREGQQRQEQQQREQQQQRENQQRQQREGQQRQEQQQREQQQRQQREGQQRQEQQQREQQQRQQREGQQRQEQQQREQQQRQQREGQQRQEQQQREQQQRQQREGQQRQEQQQRENQQRQQRESQQRSSEGQSSRTGRSRG